MSRSTTPPGHHDPHGVELAHATDAPVPPRHPVLGRRAVLGSGLLAGGVALAGVAGSHLPPDPHPDENTPPAPARAGAGFAADTVSAHTGPLFGLQPGIATPQQAHAAFLGLDLLPRTDRVKIRALLRLLGDDIDALTTGTTPLGVLEAHPATSPSRLTVTVGFGPGLLTAADATHRWPTSLASFPQFATDRFDPRWGQSDLLLQVCADDPVTVSYTQRRLLRDAAAFARPTWVQRGFVNARGAQPPGSTPRNLMGMRDGSANEKDATHLAEVVRCTDPAQPWLVGGSHLVLRRIRIDLDRWDDVEPRTKEASIGRRLDDGAPLTGHRESDPVERAARDRSGFLVVDPTAHAARAQPRRGPERMLRRGYNYDDGPRPDGSPDAGLLFAAYQADVRSAFVPVQRRLAENDALNTWISHVGSAVYAIPPAAAAGSHLGAAALDAATTAR